MNWKKWTAIGIIAAVMIAFIVLHLIQPEVTYAFTELIAFGTFILGGVAGYFISKYLSEKNEK